MCTSSVLSVLNFALTKNSEHDLPQTVNSLKHNSRGENEVKSGSELQVF